MMPRTNREESMPSLNEARDSKRSPNTGDLMLQIKLVAGARNHLDLEFSWTAA
jgi:hypothetical protein